METTADKAGEKYWTKVWKESSLPPAIDVHSKNLVNHGNRNLDKVFQESLKSLTTQDKTFLEVGCGNSVFLPYFAKQFGLKVAGIDYSEYGCEQAKKILKREKIEGEIYCADLFNPPPELHNKFDFVASFGVVEHFTDTAAVISALAKFLKTNGILITTIPNHAGLLGLLVKILNRPVYNIHVILDKNDLNKAIFKNNLNIIYSKYFINFSVMVNLEAKEKPLKFLLLRKIIAKCLAAITLFVWFIESKIGWFPEQKLFSAAIVTVAKKVS